METLPAGERNPSTAPSATNDAELTHQARSADPVNSVAIRSIESLGQFRPLASISMRDAYAGASATKWRRDGLAVLVSISGHSSKRSAISFGTLVRSKNSASGSR